MFATCSQVAANQVRCSCKPGYHGDGYYCQMNDVCPTSNGGCDVNANCLFTGPVSYVGKLGLFEPARKQKGCYLNYYERFGENEVTLVNCSLREDAFHIAFCQ